MSPRLGRVEAASARREGGAPGVMERGPRGRSRNRIWPIRGSTDIAPPGTIARLRGSQTLAGRGRGRRGGPRGAKGLREGRERRREWSSRRARRAGPPRAIAVRITPGREREGGRGRGLRGEQRTLIEDEQAAVEQLAQFHAPAGVRAPARSGRQLQPARAEPHGVIAGDDATIPAAQDAIERARRSAPRGDGLGRGAREALTERGEKLGQERVGLLERAAGAQAEFADQAVLERAPEPFDAALGLRRLRGDEADAELLEHTPEVRGVLPAAQLFGERPVLIIAPEEAEAVAVERHGDPVLSARLPQHGGVAVQIFGGPKPEGERE